MVMKNAFDESKIKRDDDGKFGSGGGGSSKKGKDKSGSKSKTSKSSPVSHLPEKSELAKMTFKETQSKWGDVESKMMDLEDAGKTGTPEFEGLKKAEELLGALTHSKTSPSEYSKGGTLKREKESIKKAKEKSKELMKEIYSSEKGKDKSGSKDKKGKDKSGSKDKSSPTSHLPDQAGLGKMSHTELWSKVEETEKKMDALGDKGDYKSGEFSALREAKELFDALYMSKKPAPRLYSGKTLERFKEGQKKATEKASKKIKEIYSSKAENSLDLFHEKEIKRGKSRYGS